MDDDLTQIQETLDAEAKRRRAFRAEYISTAAFAAKYSVSQSTVLSWVRQGLPSIRRGRVIRINSVLADQWLAGDSIERTARLAAQRVR